ncbi:MAG: hypothetical protein KDD61_08840 [Bdellovibrionales bacterium]|nr:hypothetical protein [Bdellovibrionales bacterium]
MVAISLFPAEGTIIFPEYWSFLESERGVSDRVDWVDGEYSSDALTFDLPPVWQSRFLKATKVFDTSIGSLGAKHFFIRRRLKLQQKIAPSTEFLLAYFEQSDFDTRQSHLVVEFDHFWNSHWGTGIYTELAHEKKYDDLGLALLYRFSDHQLFRLYYTEVDFSRNERNENSDMFKKAPKVYGFSYRNVSDSDHDNSFLAFGARWESPLEQVGDVLYNPYRLERTQYYLQRFMGTEFDHKFLQWEDRTTFETLSAQKKSSTVRLLEFRKQKEQPSCRWGERCSRFWGLRWNQREWRIDFQEVLHQDWLPYLGFQWRLQQIHQWELSFDYVYHEGSGPTALRSSTDEDYDNNSRMNLAYEWLFIGGSLKLYFTCDLDHFSWEGGNGQFQWIF